MSVEQRHDGCVALPLSSQVCLHSKTYIDIEIFTVNRMLENNAVLNSVELLFAE